MDVALSKMALIALVALMVIGPKDLPRAARAAGRMWGRLAAMRARLLDELRESGSPFEEARKAGLLIAEINGTRAVEHPLGAFLAEAGFVPSSLGYHLRRGRGAEVTFHA